MPDPAPQVMPYSEASIAAATRIIACGGIVAVPTETVYGLAADARNAAAVAGIYAAKGRPSFNPLIVHVLDFAAAEALAVFDTDARTLAAAFWPGPLTLVLPLRDDAGVASLVTAGLGTIAIRVPAHRAMRALLSACECPLAAPSANRSNAISPTRAAHVVASLGDAVPLVIDDGACAAGLESTIVAGRDVLRPGPVTDAMITQVFATVEPVPTPFPLPGGGRGPVTVPSPVSHPPATSTEAGPRPPPGKENVAATVTAPGQLAIHYAPSKPLRLNATTASPDEWLIGFGPVTGQDTLSTNGDLTEAAARLFNALHRADASDRARIAVASIPRTGIGEAINDRLTRAAR